MSTKIPNMYSKSFIMPNSSSIWCHGCSKQCTNDMAYLPSFFYGIHAFKYSLKVDTTLISLPMCWGGRGLIGNLYHHHTAFSCPLWPEAIEFIHTPTRKCKVPEQILETEKDAFNLFNVLFYIFLPGRYLLTLHNKLTSSESNFI